MSNGPSPNRATAEHRREPRLPTDRKATARVALGIELIDISANGARARTSIALPVGMLVKLGLGSGTERHARVVWVADGITGFEFMAPIDVAALPEAATQL